MAGQWWVVLKAPGVGSWISTHIIDPLTGNETGLAQVAANADVVQSATKPADYYKGPYATQALAQAQANAYNNPSAGSEAEEIINAGPSSGSGSSWALQFGNTKGLLTRALKILFGGILIISGVLHMTGATEKIKSALGPAGMAVLAA